MTTLRYPYPALVDFARTLLVRSGLDAAKATAVAEILVEGDLMGHDTHGLGLLGPYLDELAAGRMEKDGDPAVLADFPAAVTWDGRRLPGPWLVVEAMALATERAATQGTCTVVIRRSHHIACLAAYLKRATDQGLMMVLTCSDPTGASVAPHGGLDAVFTPNPIAAGFPTTGVPVLMDVSTSTTTNGLTGRLNKEGRKLPAQWLVDAQGVPTDDPAVLFANPKGTILPLGGMDSGHKGYGLTLLVEALTGGLAGHGRADPPEGWGATVYLQIIDPRAFAGVDAFIQQTGRVSDQCHAARPIDANAPVRTPGEKGIALAGRQRAEGVVLYPTIMPTLAAWATRMGVEPPAALTA
ncbi:MAG: Ldh family oxidoreductase [Janthinobacterium lividum]